MRKLIVSALPWLVGFALSWQMMLIWSSSEINGVGWDLGVVRIASGAVILFGLASLVLLVWRREVLQLVRKRWIMLSIFALMASIWLVIAEDRIIALLWLLQWLSVLCAVLMVYKVGRFCALAKIFIAILVVNAIVAIVQLIIQETTFTSALLNMNPRLLSDSGTAKIVGPDGLVIRSYGWFVHPNILGAYGVVGMMMSVVWLLKDAYGRWLWPVFGLVSSIVMIVVSFSRNAWIGAVVGIVSLGVWMLLRQSVISKKGLFTSIGIGAATLIVIVLSVWPLILGRFTGSAIESGGDNHRAELKVLAGEMIYENPWLGMGPSQFTVVAKTFRPEWTGAQLAPVHHLPLLVLAEWGIVGVFGLISLAILVMVWFGRVRCRLQIVLIFLLPLVVMSWFDMYLYQFWPGVALMAWVAIIILAFSTKVMRKPS